MSSPEEKYSLDIEDHKGCIHPISSTLISIISVLESYGFRYISGPEIESEEFNFDMLNIAETHPARQMHDTFYVNKKSNLLRTHTSPVQIRGMLKNKPPMAIISGGKVYRKDDDSTHLPMFHQIEGIYVDKDVTFTQLKDLIYSITISIFGDDIKLRFRPSYFPFTEPSAEVDILFPKVISGLKFWDAVLSIQKSWGIVILILHYSGFAFGLGVERIAMLKYGITDIREFYKSNLDFLKQF